jgi:muconolactone delta-isomerase
MLFHVSINVRIPRGADPDAIRKLSEQEQERAKTLQLQRKWIHLSGGWPESMRISASSTSKVPRNSMKS